MRLVPTWVIVSLMVRDGCTADQAHEALYHWSYIGRVTNHGGTTRDKALWDLYEVREVLGFTLPVCPGIQESGATPIPGS